MNPMNLVGKTNQFTPVLDGQSDRFFQRTT
jgi:hypothetical protein